jgi:hypothetical protein
VAEVLNGAGPAVIWSGNGYHLLLPVDIPEPLESEAGFTKYTDQPSRDFLRFAERFLSMGKSDDQHYSIVSFKTYLTRVPGSLNSKCLDKGMSEEDSLVRLIQEWNGIRPVINGGKLLREYYKHLADNYIKTKKQQFMEAKKLKKYHQKKWQNHDIINENKNVWFERYFKLLYRIGERM